MMGWSGLESMELMEVLLVPVAHRHHQYPATNTAPSDLIPRLIPLFHSTLHPFMIPMFLYSCGTVRYHVTNRTRSAPSSSPPTSSSYSINNIKQQDAIPNALPSDSCPCRLRPLHQIPETHGRLQPWACDALKPLLRTILRYSRR